MNVSLLWSLYVIVGVVYGCIIGIEMTIRSHSL